MGCASSAPGEGAAFVQSLPVRRFHGVGPRGAEKMAKLGIETGADLAGKDIEFLRAKFGSFGDYLFRAARGIDLRKVKANRQRKSIGAERTLPENISAPDAIGEIFDAIVETVWERIANAEARGRTVTLQAALCRFYDAYTIPFHAAARIGQARIDRHRASLARRTHALAAANPATGTYAVFAGTGRRKRARQCRRTTAAVLGAPFPFPPRCDPLSCYSSGIRRQRIGREEPRLDDLAPVRDY